MQTVPNLSTNVVYEGRQMIFCQICAGEDFDPDLILCKWHLPISKLPEDLSVYEFVETLREFGYREMQCAHPGINLGVICYLNGQEIGESEKFSSFKIGQVPLAERTCVVCIFDRDCPLLKEQLSELLIGIDLDFFLMARFVDAISDSYQSICNLTKDIFQMEYVDLVIQD
ncbi:MAG: hypothetical protein LBF42_01580, partial [Puniceicoccales bacterium]|jgi:hypothetical protein|nr:hypothetical protein [Puniceicoccales bacterium]